MGKKLYECKYEVDENEYLKMSEATHCFFLRGELIMLFLASIICLFLINKSNYHDYVIGSIGYFIIAFFCGFSMQKSVAKMTYARDCKINDTVGTIEFYENYFLIKTKNSLKKYYYKSISKYKETKTNIYLKSIFSNKYLIIKKINCSQEMVEYIKEHCKKDNKKNFDKNLKKDSEIEKILFNEYENKNNVLYENNFDFSVNTVKDNYSFLMKNSKNGFYLFSLIASFYISSIISLLIPFNNSLLLLFIVYLVVYFVIICCVKIQFKKFNDKKLEQYKNSEQKYLFFEQYFYEILNFSFIKYDYDLFDAYDENDKYIYLSSKILNRNVFIQKNNCDKQLIEFLRDKYKESYKKRV